MDDARTQGKQSEQGEQTRSGDETLVYSGADTMAETFMLTTIEQLRVIADPLRIRILDTLVARAMTVTQLGRQLGESPAKLHYHVRELERIGMVRLVMTREKEGILEKYYRAVARNFSTPINLLQSVSPDEFIATVSQTINRLAQGFLRALTTTTQQGGDHPDLLVFGGSTLWLTPGELKSLTNVMETLLEQYKSPRGVEGEREVMLATMGYDAKLGAEHGEESTSSQAQTAGDETPSASMQPRQRRVVVVGGLTYNRADLERVVARGEQLDINVSGYCSFADDVTPDLVERAVARLRYRGVLSATPAVRVALRRKEVVKEEE